MEIKAPMAILAGAYGILEYLKEMEPRAIDGTKAAFGLSMGEFYSMPFAGAMTYDETVHMMKKR